MSDSKKPKRNGGKSQSDKFKEAARELEADENEETFTEKLRRLVKPKRKGREE